MLSIGHFTLKQQNTLFSSAQETFSRVDHILGQKSSLGKFKKTEIVLSIVSDNNAIRSNINYMGKKWKKKKRWA